MAMEPEVWSRVLQLFKEETGDEPSNELDGWELCLLARLAKNELQLSAAKAKSIEQLLLRRCEGKPLAEALSCLRQKFPPRSTQGDVSEVSTKRQLRDDEAQAVALVRDASSAVATASRSSRSRSRSRHRAALRQAQKALRDVIQGASSRSVDLAQAATTLLQAGESLLDMQASAADRPGPEQEKQSQQTGHCREACLSAPACLGPPAFFPVGNAAGRHAPITRGLPQLESPRLLFAGLSDPRHILAALHELPVSARPQCVVNDLNAETCARNALIMGLLGRANGVAREMRLLAVFTLWWMHELPVALLPVLSDAADHAARNRCCEATSAQLLSWASSWRSKRMHIKTFEDLPQLLEAVSASSFKELLRDGCITNETLQKHVARLDYGLYREHPTPEGWEAAGDGVLLWPELPLEEEFATEDGQPLRSEYMAALAKHWPRFMDVMARIAEEWIEPGHVDCEYVAGDCLSLPGRVSGGFHHIYTSNVADHVGIPALALSLGSLLAEGGRLRASLSNNIRALDSTGDALTVFKKLHGIDLSSAATLLGIQACRDDQESDQLLLSAGSPEKPLQDVLSYWPSQCANLLYRCPVADPQTIARRIAGGDCRGMAHRYARRFTVSPVTVECIARLLERAVILLPETEAAKTARATMEAAKHAHWRLAQCLRWHELPEAVRETLIPGVRPQRWTHLSVVVPRDRIPGWAWRTHPPIVLLWVRVAGRARAAAAGVKLTPEEPIWARCRTYSSVAFLEHGVWGVLRWAMEASPDEVQILDGLRISMQPCGALSVSFLLPAAEHEFGAGGAAFIVSTVDNVIVAGPYEAHELQEDAAVVR